MKGRIWGFLRYLERDWVLGDAEEGGGSLEVQWCRYTDISVQCYVHGSGSGSVSRTSYIMCLCLCT